MSRSKYAAAVVLVFFASTSPLLAANNWTGAGVLWSPAGDWSGGTPVAGDDLVFATTLNPFSSNDLPLLTFNSLTYNSPGTIFTTNNNPIQLGAGGLTVGAGTTVNLNIPVTLTNPQVWNINGPLTMGAPLVLGANTLNLTGASVSTFNNSISGAGGVTLGGSGTVNFSASMTFNGPTMVGGTSRLSLNNNNPIQSPTTINNGAFLDVGSGSQPTFFSSLTINSGGTYDVVINGTSISQYSNISLSVTPPTLGGNLALTNNVVSPVGTVFKILVNTSGSPINGTFAGLPEGALITSGGNTFRISYLGIPNPNVTLTVVAPPPTVTKSFAPPAIGVNGTSTLTITLTNPGPAYTAATITDNYPGAGALVNATPASGATTCGAGIVTAANGGTSVSLTGGTIPASSSCTITVNVTSTAANSYVNTTGNVTGSGSPSSSGGTATLTVLSPPTVSKAFAPQNIAPGKLPVLTISLTNSNAVPITGVAFTDTYPANIVNAGTPNASTTCTGGTLTANAGAGSVALSGSAIPAGGCTVMVTVTSNVAGTYNNSIPAGGVTTTNAGSNTAAVTGSLTVNTPPTAAKSFTPTNIPAGGTSTLTVTLTNSNGVALTNAAFTDAYPLNLVNAPAPNGATTCGGVVTATSGGTSLALNGGAIPANGSCTVTVSVTSNTANTYNNTIGAGAVTTANSGANTAPASASLTVGAFAPPSISKSFNPNATVPNATSTLTITLTNPNSAAITSAVFTDAYPPGLVNASPASPATNCSGGTATATNGATSVALSGGTIPANGSCTVTVLVTASVAGNYVNTIPAGGVTSGNTPPSAAAASGTLVVAVGTPTLSGWALLLLALILGAVGFVFVKR